MCRNLILLSIVLSKSIVFAGAFEESICGAISSRIPTQWCSEEPIHVYSSYPSYPSLLQKRAREPAVVGANIVFVDGNPTKKAKNTDEDLERHLRNTVGARKNLSCVPISVDEEKYSEFGNKSPFLLTACQEQVIEEIRENFRSLEPMSRVLIMAASYLRTPPQGRRSTLSQLRGRIGRADKQAYCYIAINPSNPRISPGTQRRFDEFLANSYLGSDIELARGDLVRRGGGSLFCAKQKGNKPKNRYIGSKIRVLPSADDPDLAFTFDIEPPTDEEFWRLLGAEEL